MKQNSGCAKIVMWGSIVFIGLFVLYVMGSVASRPAPRHNEPKVKNAEAVSQTAIVQPSDDLSLFVSKFGPPDRTVSSENEIPRPYIITKKIVYEKESVRATYIVDGPVGSDPPYEKWKFIGFQDDRTNDVISASEVVKRLKNRQK